MCDHTLTRTLKRALACLLLAGLLGSPTAMARADAGDQGRAQLEHRSTGTAPAGTSTQAQRLSDLSKVEDESLAEHAAGEWSNSEVVMVVLLLIFLFPIGLIVLIILLITDGA